MYLQLLLIFIGIILCLTEILKLSRKLGEMQEEIQKDLKDLWEELEVMRMREQE